MQMQTKSNVGRLCAYTWMPVIYRMLYCCFVTFVDFPSVIENMSLFPAYN